MRGTIATGLLSLGGSLMAYQTNNIWLALGTCVILVTGGIFMGMSLSKDGKDE